MLDSKLQEVYERLKAREKNYRRYAIPRDCLRVLGICLPPVVGYVYVLFWSFFSFKGDLIIYVVIPIATLCGIIVLFTVLLDKKASAFSLGADERVMFHTFSILENFSRYFDSKKPNQKKEYRKVALLNANMLLSTIKRNWTINEFKLATKTLTDISELMYMYMHRKKRQSGL